MGAIRDRMIVELDLRGMAAATKKSYLVCCHVFVAHFRKSPDLLLTLTGIDLLVCPACGTRAVERRSLGDSTQNPRPPDTS